MDIPKQGYIQKFCQGGAEFWVWKKEGGRNLTIVLCEAQGGCYTLHLLCWHASITLACKMLILAKASVLILNKFKKFKKFQKCKGGQE